MVIVLDTGRTSAGRVGVDPTASNPGGWPRLDWSMDAALLLAALAARAGDHVDFIAHDRVTRTGVYNASRTELLAQLVDAMAPLQPALVESDARAMVAAVQRRIRRRALVVLLTDLNASALDEGLMAVLPQLSAKHQVLLAAVSDPRVEQLAAGRADAAQVYDAAAAERARNDRRAIASRLRRSGVDVVDAPPEELAPGTRRPLPGDEGERSALAGRDDVGRVFDVAGLPRPRSLAPEMENVTEEGDFGRDTDADTHRRRQRRRRDQGLDQTRHQQHTDQPDGHRNHRPALLGQHLPTRPVTGRDHRPAQPHPGGAREEHRCRSSRPWG